MSDLNTAISQTVSVVFDNYATTIRFDFTGSNVRVGSLEVVVTECTGERAWRVSWHLQVLLLQSSRTLTMTRTFRLKCQFLFYNDKVGAQSYHKTATESNRGNVILDIGCFDPNVRLRFVFGVLSSYL